MKNRDVIFFSAIERINKLFEWRRKYINHYLSIAPYNISNCSFITRGYNPRKYIADKKRLRYGNL